MSANLSAVLYLVAGVLFILSLRGLSSPATSRQGNFFGMIGMAIAVATTLAAHPPADGIAWLLVILGVAIGGGIGAVIARKVPIREGGLLGDKTNSSIFDNAKIKRAVPGWNATIPFARGAEEIMAGYDADPARQKVNPEHTELEEELIRWHERPV